MAGARVANWRLPERIEKWKIVKGDIVSIKSLQDDGDRDDDPYVSEEKEKRAL